MGHFLLGTRPDRTVHVSLMGKFSGAWSDLWHNFLAIFTDAKADWHALSIFFEDVFLPFAVGSIIPGLTAAVVMYYVTLPVIKVYQNSRRKRLKSRLKQLNKIS
jgi:uncharacterized protein (DUF2062 family)